jgi:small subunit ribosomal protein S6
LISKKVWYSKPTFFPCGIPPYAGFFREWRLNITRDSLPGSGIRAIEPRGGCMLRRYETIFISRADLPSDEAGGLIDRYTGIIEGMDGTVIKVENWGKRRLAYPIEKRRDGVYVRIDFAAQYKVVTEVERNLRIDDTILRFQTVKLSDKVDMAEIEREMAEAREREEALKREKEQKETALSEPTGEEIAVSEGPEIPEPEVSEETSPEETSPVETEQEGAREE